MPNPRLTPKDYALLKGAIRRAFARSALHQQVMDEGRVEHSSDKNPKCKKWAWCEVCGWVLPAWKVVVDHIVPVVEIGKEFKDYTMTEAVDRVFCDRSNLQRICPTCHDVKSSLEREQREALKPPKVKKTK